MRYVAKFLDSHFSWCVVNSKIDEGYTSLLSDRRDLCRTMRVDYVMKKVSKQKNLLGPISCLVELRMKK